MKTKAFVYKVTNVLVLCLSYLVQSVTVLSFDTWFMRDLRWKIRLFDSFPSDPWMIELIIFFWSIIFISRKTHHSSYNQSSVTQIYPRFTSFGEPSYGLPLQMVFQWKFTSRDNGSKRQTLGFRFLRIAPSLSEEMSACNARIYMFQGQIRIWAIWGY